MRPQAASRRAGLTTTPRSLHGQHRDRGALRAAAHLTPARQSRRLLCFSVSGKEFISRPARLGGQFFNRDVLFCTRVLSGGHTDVPDLTLERSRGHGEYSTRGIWRRFRTSGHCRAAAGPPWRRLAPCGAGGASWTQSLPPGPVEPGPERPLPFFWLDGDCRRRRGLWLPAAGPRTGLGSPLPPPARAPVAGALLCGRWTLPCGLCKAEAGPQFPRFPGWDPAKDASAQPEADGSPGICTTILESNTLAK